MFPDWHPFPYNLIYGSSAQVQALFLQQRRAAPFLGETSVGTETFLATVLTEMQFSLSHRL
jgi:hypothetical protein